MKVPLICPYCGHKVKELDTRAGNSGQTIHCSKCKKQFKYSYKPGATSITTEIIDKQE